MSPYPDFDDGIGGEYLTSVALSEPVNPHMAFIDGLRELADFIERTPGAPIPLMPTLRLQVDHGEYDAVIAVIGAQTSDRTGGYDVAERSFGPIRYGVQRQAGNS